MREVPLAPLTTLRVGGSARAFVEVKTEEELRVAAREARGACAFLGGGSNLLVPDEGVNGLVIKIAIPGIEFREGSTSVEVSAGAGVTWDALVETASERELWGIENLAGIPGTVGGAAVQNIGAYGAELGSVFAYADALDLATGESVRIEKEQAHFGYRESRFKTARALAITRVALTLERRGTPNLTYVDVAERMAREPATRPGDLARAIRDIRTHKFPDLAREGTAGSFFKNPIVPGPMVEHLLTTYPQLPHFPLANGAVKLSLAWILDHVLHLKGFSIGKARLFERQPLVIATTFGASAREVEALAREVTERVEEATGIAIEREVETMRARKLSTTAV